MTHLEGKDSSPTPVTIFGRTYSLRGGEDPRYLHELASHVDAKMREIAHSTGTADSLNVAILAALNIVDDYFQASRRSEQTVGNETRLARLVTLLDEALAG